MRNEPVNAKGQTRSEIVRLALKYGDDWINRATKKELVFVRKVQKNISKKERALRLTGEHRPTVKLDIDNYTKSTLGALNGVLWDDDTQIVRMILDKIYTDTHGGYRESEGME